MAEVFIVDAVRTAIAVGKPTGALHTVHPVNLLSQVLDGVVSRVGLDKSLVEDIVTYFN
jgi:acetyl-CoA acyltransferase